MIFCFYLFTCKFSINKTAQEDAGVEQPVSKWTLSEFWAYLEKQGYNSKELFVDIKNLALKAVIACESHIREHQAQHSDFPFVRYF